MVLFCSDSRAVAHNPDTKIRSLDFSISNLVFVDVTFNGWMDGTAERHIELHQESATTTFYKWKTAVMPAAATAWAAWVQ